MLTVERHGRTLRFDVEGFIETPYVLRPLERGKVYEEELLEHIRSLALEGEYVDAGAHLGTHAVWFAALCPATRVHAFEPVGRYREVVARNVRANELEGLVTIHPYGLSDVPGTASNHMSKEHQFGFTEEVAGVTEHFEVVCLDEVVTGPVAVIKFDMEGMEPPALRGARQVLERDHPVVFAEAKPGRELDAVRAVLEPLGYEASGRVFNASPTHELVWTAGVGGR